MRDVNLGGVLFGGVLVAFIVILFSRLESNSTKYCRDLRCEHWQITSPNFGTYDTAGKPVTDELHNGTGQVAGSVTFRDARTRETMIVTPPYQMRLIDLPDSCK